mgnify:CR=1 FL=1
MRYVESECIREFKDSMYRFYITDALKAFGRLNVRYYDLVDMTPPDPRTSEEVVSHISNMLDKLGEEG